MKECEVLPQGLRWCRCSWRPSRTCLLGSPWHSERSGAWRLGHRPAPPTWLPKKKKPGDVRQMTTADAENHVVVGWTEFNKTNPDGQREDGRLLEHGQKQVRQDEEVKKNLQDPVVVEQVESGHGYEHRRDEKTGQTLSSELNWWRCFLAES